MMIKLCSIRDICKAIGEFEQRFHQEHGLAFNEAMAMCALSQGPLSFKDLAYNLGFAASNALNVVKSVEDKGYIERTGNETIEGAYFKLTQAGDSKIQIIKNQELPLSDLLERLVLVAEIFEQP